MNWETQANTEEAPSTPLPFPINPCIISGARASGKSSLLREICAQKDKEENCLAIIPWPQERELWSNFLLKNQTKKIALHTPDSLAKHLITLWAKIKKKTITWVVDNEEKSIITEKEDSEESYANNLLNKGQMTAGVAHWLLDQEIEDFLKKGLLPNTVHRLILDDPESWEQEASSWIRKIPAERVWETTKENIGEIYLEGTFFKGKRITHRSLEIEPTNQGTGEWLCRKINELKASPITVVIQENNKEAWEKYISTRSKKPFKIQHAIEFEGKPIERNGITLIPNLKKNWGTPKNARDWLDLIVSKSERSLARIHPEEQPYWLPKLERNKNFLCWPA